MIVAAASAIEHAAPTRWTKTPSWEAKRKCQRKVAMNWLPGWNTTAGADWWSNFYFWAGIAALFFLGLSEVISHRYTLRKDELVSEQQSDTQRRHDEEMARLRLETEAAKARAKEAELALEKFRAPRIPTAQQLASFIERIKPFAGTKFDIGHAPVGREQWDFLWLLEPAFPKAGWLFVEWQGPQTFSKLNWATQPHTYGVANVSNVSIELNPESRAKLLPAAQALSDALNSLGIAATVEPNVISSSSMNFDAVHILVGAKQ
jgi:hypothetical protein